MLRMSCIPLALVVLALVTRADAQDAAAAPAPREASFQGQSGQVAASGVVAPTEAMWFYEQETRRHDDQKLAVRRKAEARAHERQNRLAAMQWYGISNSRPMVAPTPWNGGYSAYWGSNSYDPSRWRPAPPIIVVDRPTDGPY